MMLSLFILWQFKLQDYIFSKLNVMNSFLYLGTAIFAFILTGVISGCSSHHSQSGSVASVRAYPAIIERAKKDKKYFIMYSGVNIYTVVSVQVDKAKENITVQLDKVDTLQLANGKTASPLGDNSGKIESPTLSKVYLYMKDSTSYTLDEPHTIPLVNVSRIELQK